MWQTKISFHEQVLEVREWREDGFEMVMTEAAWKALLEALSPLTEKDSRGNANPKGGLLDSFIRLYGKDALPTEVENMPYRSIMIPANDPFGMKLKTVKDWYPLSLETIAQDIFTGHVDDFTFYGWELRKGKTTNDLNKAIRKGKDPKKTGAKLENEISMAALYLKDVLKKARHVPSGTV